MHTEKYYVTQINSANSYFGLHPAWPDILNLQNITS